MAEKYTRAPRRVARKLLKANPRFTLLEFRREAGLETSEEARSTLSKTGSPTHDSLAHELFEAKKKYGFGHINRFFGNELGAKLLDNFLRQNFKLSVKEMADKFGVTKEAVKKFTDKEGRTRWRDWYVRRISPRGRVTRAAQQGMPKGPAQPKEKAEPKNIIIRWSKKEGREKALEVLRSMLEENPAFTLVDLSKRLGYSTAKIKLRRMDGSVGSSESMNSTAARRFREVLANAPSPTHPSAAHEFFEAKRKLGFMHIKGFFGRELGTRLLTDFLRAHKRFSHERMARELGVTLNALEAFKALQGGEWEKWYEAKRTGRGRVIVEGFKRHKGRVRKATRRKADTLARLEKKLAKQKEKERKAKRRKAKAK